MVVHPESNDHLRIRKFIHEGLLSSLSKKHQSGKVSMDNAALGFDYKLSINMLMKQLYIAVRYFYVTIRLTLEDWKRITKLSTYQLQPQEVIT